MNLSTYDYAAIKARQANNVNSQHIANRAVTMKFRQRGGRGKRRGPGEMNGTERRYAQRLEELRQKVSA